jgi:cytochrome c oxidase subunit 4
VDLPVASLLPGRLKEPIVRDESSQEHVASYGSLALVWAALVLLTLVLVAVSTWLGGAAAVVAMLLITPTKASIVSYFFMDLREAGSTIRKMVFAVLGTLVVFIGLLFSDYLYR